MLASKLNSLRSDINEASLRHALFLFFNNLQKKLLKALEEYWNDDFMVQGQIELILAPIFESQKEYYELLLEHNLKEFKKGQKTATRLVDIAKGNINAADKAENTNLKKSFKPSFTNQKDLFGTLKHSEDLLRNQTFVASEYTMNRVDSDINNILEDGYKSGKGINAVRDNITKRFTQLKSWEAQRIARTEIHNAQEIGIMNGYETLGVEYTEWDSAHDKRVRGLKKHDKADHVHLSGEIIPMGGTYSNGLRYPGDRSGPVYEWINCRCGNLPFIMPDGYTAPPGQMQFREKDIVKINVKPVTPPKKPTATSKPVTPTTQTTIPTQQIPTKTQITTNLTSKELEEYKGLKEMVDWADRVMQRGTAKQKAYAKKQLKRISKRWKELTQKALGLKPKTRKKRNSQNPKNKVLSKKEKQLTIDEIKKLTFDELATYHDIEYKGIQTYNYDNRKYHVFVERFDNGETLTLRFEQEAVKSYEVSANEIINEVFNVPKIMKKETNEIWFKDTEQGIIHKSTETGYDSLDARTLGYNSSYKIKYKKSHGLKDPDHRIVINPRCFKEYVQLGKDTKITIWKHTIHHEFTHSVDKTRKDWKNNVKRKTCYQSEYRKIHKEEPYFTNYANEKREESFAEHGGYVSHMLNNPAEHSKTIRIYDYKKCIEKDINFEEYKQMYPKHYEYFSKLFKKGAI